MRKPILICIIMIMFVTTACNNKMDEEEIFESNEIQQIEQVQEVQPQELEQVQEVESQELEPQELEQSNLQWPKDFIPGVPVLQGQISRLNFDVPREGDEVQEPQYVRIELVNIEESVADQFIEGLKAGGYTQNPVYEKNEVHTKYYVQGLNAEQNGYRVYFKWDPINKSAFTVLIKPGWLALSAYIFSYDDTTDEDLSPWPENFLPNFPEPKGKIIDVTSSDMNSEGSVGESYDIILYYGDRQSVFDCMEEMKKRYFIEADEVITDNFLMYSGLSEFYDNGIFDSAYIGFEDISNSPYIKLLEPPEGKFRIISVSMSKSK